MRFRKIENRLAALAAVIVLIGVSTAAENALAEADRDGSYLDSLASAVRFAAL